MRRSGPGRDRRGGFTLVELLVVTLILGILAAIAIPRIRGAVARADAAHILGDVNTIRLAAFEYLSETGAFPPSGPLGAPPSELVDLLPGGYDFEHEDVRYRWVSVTFGTPANPWNASRLGMLWVDLSGNDRIAEAMRHHRTSTALWTPTVMLFLFPA